MKKTTGFSKKSLRNLDDELLSEEQDKTIEDVDLFVKDMTLNIQTQDNKPELVPTHQQNINEKKLKKCRSRPIKVDD
jgi:hypothetical protein